jgi:hypothetical protein
VFVHPILIKSTIGATRPLSAAEGHFLAGLIDAESSFTITPNNGGQNWSCSITVNLRDDDADVLVELQRLTGLGRLYAIPGRRTSRPQVAWRIQSRLECHRLATLLERFPLRGRKRLELAVWKRALHELTEDPRSPALPNLAAEIRALRRYVNPSEATTDDHSLGDGLIEYLGGFFTGEGCLLLSPSQCRTVVKLRDDDRALLEQVLTATGLGRIYPHPARGGTRPSVSWIVLRADELRPMVHLLEQAGLRGRKQREFVPWRRAALEFAAAKDERRRRDPLLIEQACADLKEARAYHGPSTAIVSTPLRERHAQAYLTVLRAAAGSTDGALTSTDYEAMRARNPDWPTRNTITRAFGAWAAALDAAGLSDRCSRRAHASREHPPAVWPGFESRRRAAQARVLDAVWELARDLRRPPRIHEFLHKRAVADRSLPTLGTLYRILPDGWASVLDAASLTPGAIPAEPGSSP